MCEQHWTKPFAGSAGAASGRVPEVAPEPRGFAAKMLYGAVRFYQKYLSALKMGSTCRFEPVCSAYALEAISAHGAFKGLVLTLARLAKCGPWHPGGFDPVPPSVSMKAARPKGPAASSSPDLLTTENKES